MYCGGIEPPDAELSPVSFILKVCCNITNSTGSISHFQYDKLQLTTKIFIESHTYILSDFHI